MRQALLVEQCRQTAGRRPAHPEVLAQHSRRAAARGRRERQFPRPFRGSRRPRQHRLRCASASCRSASSIRPPGKTSAPAANAMPPARSTISSSGGPLARSRTRISVAAGIASSLTGRAAAYIPLTFCSSASLGLTVLSTAAAFSSWQLCWWPAAWALRVHRRLVGELVELLGVGLVELRILDRVLIVAMARRKRQTKPLQSSQKPVFSLICVPHESRWAKPP